MAWAMMREASLGAFRHLDLDIAGFAKIFVSGKSKLENIISDFVWNLEERRG